MTRSGSRAIYCPTCGTRMSAESWAKHLHNPKKVRPE